MSNLFYTSNSPFALNFSYFNFKQPIKGFWGFGLLLLSNRGSGFGGHLPLSFSPSLMVHDPSRIKPEFVLIVIPESLILDPIIFLNLGS